MKQFFKAVLQIKYTLNDEKYDFKSLKDYLIENQQIGEDFDFEGQIKQFDGLIQNLIGFGDDDTEDKFSEICQHHNIEDDRVIKELKGIWESEKDTVYSFIVKSGTSYKKLDKVEWSINNKFYGKKAKNLKEISCLMNLKVSDIKGKNQKFLTFEMNQNQLQQLTNELNKIEDEIRNLILQQQEDQEEQQ